MNFLALKTRLETLLGRAPDAVCYELVTADINQELNLHQMEKTASLTEAAVVDLPADFLKAVSLYRDTDPRVALTPIPAEAYQRAYDVSGVPRRYAIENDRLLLTPTPSGSEGLVLRYIARVIDLAADTDTNAVLEAYPSVYVYGVLTHHALLNRNMEGLQGWAAAYEKAKGQAQAEANKYRRGNGSSLPVAPRSVA